MNLRAFTGDSASSRDPAEAAYVIAGAGSAGCVIMMAQKAADLIRGQPPMPAIPFPGRRQ